MSHTIRGGDNACSSASRSSTALQRAPAAKAVRASGFGSKPTTSMPPRASLRAMLAPMRPNPTIPICMSALPWTRKEAILR